MRSRTARSLRNSSSCSCEPGLSVSRLLILRGSPKHAPDSFCQERPGSWIFFSACHCLTSAVRRVG
jgi:hypothetical protein